MLNTTRLANACVVFPTRCYTAFNSMCNNLNLTDKETKLHDVTSGNINQCNLDIKNSSLVVRYMLSIVSYGADMLPLASVAYVIEITHI